MRGPQLVHALEGSEDVRRERSEARRGAAAVQEAVDPREDLDRHDARAAPDARERQVERPPVAGGDTCHVRAVAAALGLERAVDTGARPKLLICAVRAECRALRPLRGGIAGLFHDFTGEEWMRGVDPAVDYRHRSAGAVEAEGPGKIGADQRDAIPQDRLVDSVLHHALDREVRRFELFERRRTDAERHQWRRQIATQNAILVLRQPAQNTRAGVGDLLSVCGARLDRERAFRDAAGGKREHDEHAHLAFSERTIVQCARHHAWLLIRRRRERVRGQDDGQQQQIYGN